jgi:membrane protein implicated in regulation of membrane protease activity
MEWLEDFLKPEFIWCLVGIVLVLMEFMVPGLVVIFFGIGALAVGVLCLFVDISLNVQLIVFSATSVASLVLLRQWLKGVFMGHVKGRQELNEEMREFVGETAVVKTKITPTVPGKVEFHGTNWIAAAEEDIEAGAVVEIVGKENITLKVKAV